jgi:glutathionylspermidine synthase
VKRRAIGERPDWREQAAEVGFDFHTADGVPYWDETACYSFTLRQVEDHLEAAANELASLCYAAAGRILGDAHLMERCGVPVTMHGYLRQSWERQDRDLYGRFDVRYDGSAAPKLYEFNADTPTGLFEAAVFQWLWLEGQTARGELGRGADQFNSIQEHLIDGFGNLGIGGRLHFSSVRGHEEDRGTVSYLEDCARQAGLETAWLAIEDIGVDQMDRLIDTENRIIDTLFKLYPWEWLFAEPFGEHLPRSGARLIEPPWKAVLSSKALLPVLWDMFPDHPNLLPAYFEDDDRAGSLDGAFARKPLHGREGANIRLVSSDGEIVSPGPYDSGPAIVQALAPLPDFDGNRPVLGLWIVAGESCGLGIREERSAITTNTARFVPHVIE